VLRRRAPLPAGAPNYVTRRGLYLLRDELTRLDAAPAPVGPAERQAHAARRSELEDRIATAVVPPAPSDADEIRFGARVRLSTAAGPRQLQIVGVDEADPPNQLIAFTAPLARALLGRRAGETVTARSPGGEEELEIQSVSYD
jgi:transcription elongation factor GreB